MKFSNQALGTMLVTLQKCLMEETDIMDLMKDWDVEEKDGELFIVNPPIIETTTNNTEQKFEIPDNHSTNHI